MNLAAWSLIGIRDPLTVHVADALVGSLDAHAAAEFLREVARVQVRRLQHMAVRVDDSKPVSHGSSPSAAQVLEVRPCARFALPFLSFVFSDQWASRLLNTAY